MFSIALVHATSPYSGMNHDSTAFVGCDQDEVRKADHLPCFTDLLANHALIIRENSQVRIPIGNKFCIIFFLACSVVHVLDLKVDDKTIVVPNALQSMVELLSRKLSFGFGFELECLNVCGKSAWNSR